MAESNQQNKCNSHFFEGAEKLLEIWFSVNAESTSDLRVIPRDIWKNLLKSVKCSIISFTRNEDLDAYVLSESSMFISKRRWILKTCGSTTPLECLKPLLKIVENYGFFEVEDLFYSRKNFSRPELQIFPHCRFSEEVAFLDTIFEDGRSYCLGSLNRDCWYLYTFSNNKGGGNALNSEPDQTIEILMRDLDFEPMSVFSKENSPTASAATKKIGIQNIIPKMIIDDYLFDPCGYSMNGITDMGQYMTIHVTPENEFSYVSFESNIALSNYAELIHHVIKMFRPKRFLVTIFANKTSKAYTSLEDSEFTENFAKWTRTDMQYCHFPSYNLIFAQYARD